MPPQSEVLGVLHPVGGGDPIPLMKHELTVGRRPSCDIRLDYENISGKHCVLRLINGVWSVRDLGSTNGTTVNGSRIAAEQSVMPDEELGVAGHLFTIDYDPAGPEAFLGSHKEMDEEIVQARARHSLMDLAGMDTDNTTAKPKRPKRSSHGDRAALGRRGGVRRRGSSAFQGAAETRQETTQRRRLPQVDRRGREEAQLTRSARLRPGRADALGLAHPARWNDMAAAGGRATRKHRKPGHPCNVRRINYRPRRCSRAMPGSSVSTRSETEGSMPDPGQGNPIAFPHKTRSRHGPLTLS